MKARSDQLKILKTLRKRSDFLKVAAAGRKWVSHGLIVQIMPNGLDVVRLGLTVSKKTSLKAVIRNRIKRRLRAVAADVLAENLQGEGNPLAAGYDVVLIGRPATATRPYVTLKNDLLWCLEKLLTVSK